jgi:hypothetical protein
MVNPAASCSSNKMPMLRPALLANFIFSSLKRFSGIGLPALDSLTDGFEKMFRTFFSNISAVKNYCSKSLKNLKSIVTALLQNLFERGFKFMNAIILSPGKAKFWSFLFLVLASAFFFIFPPTDSSAGIDANKRAPGKAPKSPVFAEFDSWVDEYLKGNTDADFLSRGEEIAMRRRAVFHRLIEESPQESIELAVAEKIRASLPFTIAQNLEKEVSFRGDFLVRVEDLIDPSGELHESRTVREVRLEDAKLRAFVDGAKAAMTTKYDIPMRGVVLDDLIALAKDPVRVVAADEYRARGIDETRIGAEGVAAEAGDEIVYFPDRREFEKFAAEIAAWEEKIGPVRDNASLSPWTEGAKTVLLIRVDFAERQGEPVDQGGAPLTVERAQNLINNGVNQFYVSNSYNKTSLSAVVTPVVRMPQPQSFYTGANSDLIFVHAREAARLAGFETNNFNLDLIAFGFNNIFGYAGFAKIGDKGAVLNGFFDFKTAAHELGHCYGLLHANTWRTTDGTVIGSGANVEYGDAFDVMGGGGSQITHFNASYKRTLDWLTETNVQTVTSGGIYRVYAFDVVNSPNGIHALKIKKDGLKNYWIEFRQLFTGTPGLMNGAMVRWDYGVPQVENRRQTQVLDMTPSTQSLADSTLLIGQSFVDNAAGLTVTVLGRGNTTPESLDIKVDFNFSRIRGAAFDFDGDNRSDIGVFRPSNGIWYLSNSTRGFWTANWGLASDRLVPAKFNNDRQTDVAVYRNGTWYVYNSAGGQSTVVQFGLADDLPVPGDYDGDGFGEMTVFRSSNGTWHMWNWVFQRYTSLPFGAPGDVPVPADYDGDGRMDVAVFRPSNGQWWIRKSGDSAVYAFQFGTADDKPVPADFTGDGRTDAAFWRPATGEWFILRSEDSSFYSVPFGTAGDLPAPGDYDGDGRADTAVFRPSTGTWYVDQTTAGTLIANFGLNGDRPLPNVYVP